MDREILENACYLEWDITNSLEFREFILRFPTIQYSSFVLCIITCIIGLPANIIVILVTGFLMKKNKYKIWFLNLALADFTFLLIQALTAASVMEGKWSYGSSVCKLYHFFTFVNMYAGIYILTALNIDRALSVTKPIWHLKFLSKKFCWSVCAAIWVTSAICNIPTIIYSDVHEIYSEYKLCALSYNQQHKSVESSSDYSLQNQPSQSDSLPVQRELCRNFTNNMEITAEVVTDLAILKEARFSVLHFVGPLSVFGYIIPLCAILFSNIIIAFHVKNLKMVASSRLYRVVILEVMSFFCVRTPYVCACFLYWLYLFTLQYTLMFKVSLFQPPLYFISATNSLLNPVVYVLVGKQVWSELIRFFRKTK
ncbi:hypothetical protein GDO78_022531 [Eleutherodactylus coqui]|uniref:G-protein coupled receptors family 1 profile domain-containing protein n=1 Tax=Eleutherodactylus coqui TaxID=57060 RepID=A0A8J6B4L0_ELECQ|nr:hypothetical protein GDO78_022531 [Eleutherodactylus coqui]